MIDHAIDDPLAHCVVTAKPLGDRKVVVLHDEIEVHLCCDECAPAFARAPEKHLARVREARK